VKFKYYLRGAGIGVIVSTVVLAVAFLFQKNTMSDAEIIQRAMELGMVMEENSDNKTLADISEKNATKADMETGADQEPGGDGNGVTATDGASGEDKSGGSDASDKESSNKDSSDKDSPAKDTSGGDNPDRQESDGESESGSDASAPDKDAADKAASDKNNSDKNNPDKQQDKDPDKNDSGKDDPEKDSSGGDSSKKDEGDAEEKTVTVTVNSGDVSRIVSDKVYEAGLVESADDFNSYLGANGYDKKLRSGTYEIKVGSSYKQIAKILTTRK